ncbi:MAG: sigma 54-interacting transcriptional regulator [Deferrisomatales bacterium]|nr:sigma 54-interacting transcriptional regulator [Deferrisomatales bacterium]
MDGSPAVRELRALYRVSQCVHATLDLPAAVRSALGVLAEELGMQRGALALVDPDSGELVIEVAHGLSPAEIRRGRYRSGEGVMGRVLATGEPMAVPCIGAEPLFLDRTGARRRLDRSRVAFLCVPVRWGSDIVGVLSADRLTLGPADLEEDLRLLTLVADVIAQAVGVQRRVRGERSGLERENRELRQQLREPFATAGVVGASRGMAAVRGQIELAARSSAPVLVSGEEGSGRRTVARAIHLLSERAERPLLRVPCGGASAPVVAGALFGDPDALGGAPGALVEAGGGCVLLEAVERLPADSQERLLPVLQEGCFPRAGERVPVRCRVLAYTAVDLAGEVRAGRFDEMLYHRLNAVPLHLPPLRRRRGDIPLLVSHFLDQLARRDGTSALRWPQACTELLQRWNWPGNVGELRQVVEQAARASSGGSVAAADLPASLRGKTGAAPGALAAGALEAATRDAAEELLREYPEGRVHRAVLDRVERALLELALERSGGVKLAAARLLGINRNTLYHKLALIEEP